jgi:hypothetical protein
MTRYLIVAGCVVAVGAMIVWYKDPNRVVTGLMNDSTEVRIVDMNKSIFEQKEVVAIALRSKVDIESLRPMLKCNILGWTDMKVCACAGNARLDFYNGTKLIGKIGIQHNKELRIKGISSDCDLVDSGSKSLSHYMKKIGIVEE